MRSYGTFNSTMALATAGALVAALYGAFLGAPTEMTMGDIQRIFYIHVPSAWTSFAAFFVVFVAGIAYLATKNLKWDRIALACAEIGTIFCTVVLITGPIWAKPVWGIWWTLGRAADLHAASVADLPEGYMLLRGFLEEPARRATLAAVFGIFGFATVPFVFMTIRLWRTQHPQPVIMGGEGSGLDPVMFQALMVSWAAFLILFVFLATLRVRLEKDRDQVRQLRRELMVQ